MNVRPASLLEAVSFLQTGIRGRLTFRSCDTSKQNQPNQAGNPRDTFVHESLVRSAI